MEDILGLLGQSEGIGNLLLLTITIAVILMVRYDLLPLLRDRLLPYLQERQARHDRVIADLIYLKSQIEAIKYVQGVQDEKLSQIQKAIMPCLRISGANLRYIEQQLGVVGRGRDYNRDGTLEAIADE